MSKTFESGTSLGLGLRFGLGGLDSGLTIDAGKVVVQLQFYENLLWGKYKVWTRLGILAGPVTF